MTRKALREMWRCRSCSSPRHSTPHPPPRQTGHRTPYFRLTPPLAEEDRARGVYPCWSGTQGPICSAGSCIDLRSVQNGRSGASVASHNIRRELYSNCPRAHRIGAADQATELSAATGMNGPSESGGSRARTGAQLGPTQRRIGARGDQPGGTPQGAPITHFCGRWSGASMPGFPARVGSEMRPTPSAGIRY